MGKVVFNAKRMVRDVVVMVRYVHKMDPGANKVDPNPERMLTRCPDVRRHRTRGETDRILLTEPFLLSPPSIVHGPAFVAAQRTLTPIWPFFHM